MYLTFLNIIVKNLKLKKYFWYYYSLQINHVIKYENALLSLIF